MKAERKYRKWKILGAIVLCLAVLLGVEIYRSARCLKVSYYQARSEKVDGPVRIVQLTDLHNAEFGADNRELVSLVAAQEPDLILCTGDLVTGFVEETSVAETLLERLTEVAPVYVSMGNHEQMYEGNYGTDLTALFARTGARVLEYTYEDVEIAGQALRLGGISGYGLAEKHLKTGEARPDECDFLREFQDTSRCTLLLAHMPAGWIASEGLEEWDMDLVFSGHAHGGQVVLPLLGGVYAPDMGFFPGKLEGLIQSEDGKKTLVLSSGLGSSSVIPRFNNPPQVLVLDLEPLL